MVRWPDPRPGGGQPASVSRQLLEQGVEVFQLCVFDDDFAAATVIFDVNLEAEGTLQTLLDFANIGVDGRLRLGIFLSGALGMEESLNVILCLANRKRKSGNSLGCFLDLLGVLKGQQGASMTEAEFARLYASLHR